MNNTVETRLTCQNCTPERQFARSRSCVVRLIQFSNGSCLVYCLSISPAFSLFSLRYSIWISIQSLSRGGTMATAVLPGHCGEEAKCAHEGQQTGAPCELQDRWWMAPLLFLPLCKNIMFTQVLITRFYLWWQDLHNGDYLLELQYHGCVDTLGHPNLVIPHLRSFALLIYDSISRHRLSIHSKMEKLERWRQETFTARKYPISLDSEGKKDGRNAVRCKLSIGSVFCTPK